MKNITKIKNSLTNIYDDKNRKKLQKLLKDYENGKIDKIKILDGLYDLLHYYQYIYKAKKYDNANEREFLFNNIKIIIDNLNIIYKSI
jgi:predicted nuclease of restriction endonuclease-like RecB superfamily